MRTMNHAAFVLYYHLTLQVKYRHKLITEEMLQRLESIFRNTLGKWRCSIVSFSGATDHVHILFEAHPSLDLSQLIANLKTVSSRLIRKEYSEYLAKFFGKRSAKRNESEGLAPKRGQNAFAFVSSNDDWERHEVPVSAQSLRSDRPSGLGRECARSRPGRIRVRNASAFWSSSYGLKSISKGAEFDVIIKYIQNQERPQPSKPQS